MAKPTAKLDSGTSVVLTWVAPADGGSPITGYVLTFTTDLGVYTLEWNDPSTSARVYNLDPDTTYQVSVAAVNAIGTGASSEAVVFATPFVYIERQFGADRYETAARVSERAFPYSGIDGAFVVNGQNFPDALAAAAAAGTGDGPVLLTKATTLAQPTADELQALQPGVVVIAGGKAVVSDAVANKAGTYATQNSLRLAGATRFGTAAEVSRFWDTADTVYLANGQNFPDALAGAAAAGYKDSPVLLTKATTLPSETAAALKRLKPKKIVVLGGTGVVSTTVANKAKAATGVTTSLTRQAGADRYTTAVAISKAAFPTAGVPVVYVTNGKNFPDALAGAAAAAHLGGPVLLTDPAVAPASVINEIKRLKPQRIVVLGGPTVVSNKVVSQLNATR
ncbi:cell wall-binding repeat-containing protein [Microbacterium sp. NPDC057659]|uniref:cell wall-binding repeat-containing protein n=1 Tax=Microbacterium sp. NPDC057659 TaxID=3346198 RepID=UPI00366CCBEC